MLISLLAMVSLTAAAQEPQTQEQIPKTPAQAQVDVIQQVQDLSSDLEGLGLLAPLKLTLPQLQAIIAEVQPAVDRIFEQDAKREKTMIELRDAMTKAKADALVGSTPSADVMSKIAAAQKAAGLDRAKAADDASVAIWDKLTTLLDANQKNAVYELTRKALKNTNTPNYDELPQKKLGAYYTREVLMLPRQIRLMNEMITAQKAKSTKGLNE